MLRRGRMYDRVRLMLYGQLLLVMVASAVFWLQGGAGSALSSLCGGSAAILPGLAFAMIFARFNPGVSPDQQVKRFYWGEAVKFLLTVLSFVAIFQWKEVSILPLMLTYSLAFGAYWLALLI